MAVQFDNRFGAAAAHIDRAASELVRKTALEIEADIKRDMASAKHGRRYGSHVASAPGEAPAVDHGTLINSVQVALDGAYAAEVGSPLEAAPLLEVGTERIAPRPAFARAGERAKNTFRRNAERLT